MNEILILLRPRLFSMKNRKLSDNRKGTTLKFAVMGIIGAMVWAGLFAVSLRVLLYFKNMEKMVGLGEDTLLGDIVAYKLLSVLTLTAFSLLIFSSILTILTKLYLSGDLALVHSMPVSSRHIFIARWLDSTFESTWMVIIYIIPIFIAYGIVFKAGMFFYADIILSMFSMSFTASALSAILVVCSVVMIPANRMKNIFIFSGLTLFLILYVAFRLLKPELLANPEGFASFLVYVKALKSANPIWLPSTWAFDSIKAALAHQTSESVFHLALSCSFAGLMIFLSIITADSLYFKGLSKTQTSGQRFFKQSDLLRNSFKWLPSPVRAMLIKEIKTFFRDQSQWTQLFLIAALVAIYIYNFKVLPMSKSPIPTLYLQNLLSFLNMGLALAVLASVTIRFAFPAVSIEGEAFWILKSAPIRLRHFLWIKFFIYYFPLLILTEILIIVTNSMLQVTMFMMILSPITVFFLVPGVVAIGIGMGAAYPDFKAENPTQIISSYGGLMSMIVSTAVIGIVIILEARPVYKIFMADIKGFSLTLFDRIWIGGSFASAFIISILSIFIPMRFGEKQLSKRFE